MFSLNLTSQASKINAYWHRIYRLLLLLLTVNLFVSFSADGDYQWLDEYCDRVDLPDKH